MARKSAKKTMRDSASKAAVSAPGVAGTWRPSRLRAALLAAMGVVAAGLLMWRLVDLQLSEGDFLLGQGDARHKRLLLVPAHRGKITDRNGSPLAISAPVESLWAVPAELLNVQSRLPELARLLGKDTETLRRRLNAPGRSFVYLKRNMIPDQADKVMALEIPGVYSQSEYRRFYPAGEVFSHILGFTDIDDGGQEGLELAYNEWLQGEPGKRRVGRDRLGRVIRDYGIVNESKPGQDLVLSLDRRIQYLLYRELKRAVQINKARAASAMILDVRTGEVLAAVNQPSFNPNDRRHMKASALRNRVFTDVLEPGSTMKPFTILGGLESGKFTPDTPVDTTPGWYSIGSYKVRDTRNYGLINVSRVITKSSNVGASRIALQVPKPVMAQVLQRVGFGQPLGSGFPGEAIGTLRGYQAWKKIDRATMSFGYGISVSLAQLAHAYSVIASDGVLRPMTLLKVDNGEGGDAHLASVANGEQVIKARYARQVRTMMETVVSDEGTAKAASIPGYRVAGKTGTVRKLGASGYKTDSYRALFAGIVPASAPRLVMVVMVDEPSNGVYYGGLVAAPVFARTMPQVLRIMDVRPDDPQSLPAESATLQALQAGKQHAPFGTPLVNAANNTGQVL